MFMDVINFIMDAGSSVFMPLIILILGLIFGLKFGKAFQAGITVGFGFVGINLIIGLLSDTLMTVINSLVDIYGFKLSVIDVGWPIAASIAWSGGAIVPVVLVAVFLLNILLIIVRWTKTLDIDIWNYWGLLFLGSAIYLGTHNIALSVIAPCISMFFLLKFSDIGQPYIEKFMGVPGITSCNLETMCWVLIGAPLNKLIDKIPGLRDIDWSPDRIQKRLGILGEPYIIGLVLGAILAIAARTDATTVLNTAIMTGASIFLLPKMIGVLMEGLMPISNAASDFMQKRFKNRQINIGLDAAILVGHPTIVATVLLLIPTTLILAVILPGNTVLPLAELSGIGFFIVWAVVPSKGNVFRGWLIGTLFMVVILLVASNFAPVMTDLGNEVGFEFPEGSSKVSCLTIGGEWISYILYKLSMLFA
jgi:PTS system galactitol-specific IIC component